MTRVKVYISGPLSNNGTATASQEDANVDTAIDAFVELAQAGFAPLCPHLTYFVEKKYPGALLHEEWLSIDFAWMRHADCVLRLPGDSVGAEIEEKFAKLHHIPVFTNTEELKRAFYLDERKSSDARRQAGPAA